MLEKMIAWSVRLWCKKIQKVRHHAVFVIAIMLALALVLPLFVFESQRATAQALENEILFEPSRSNLPITLSSLKSDADFSKRRGHSSVVLDNGDIILMGGFLDFDVAVNDVWKSEDGGATWEEINSEADWAARGWHSSVVLPDNSIVLLGGNDTAELYNDVWRSDDGGESWTELTAGADWSARESFASVVLDDGSIILMGGNDGDATWIEPDYVSDVWVSTDQGASWDEVTAPAEWSGRSGHASVILDDGRIVLMGGYDESGSINDVWRSDDGGESWTELTAGADWMKRGDYSSIVLSDDSILITGGLYFVDQMEEVAVHGDVWRSDDGGESWTLVTDDADWVGRYGHSCVVLADEGNESIVLMGGRDVNWSHRNDVWRSTDDGESWEQVAGFPNPYFRVYPQFYWISGEEWPGDADLTIEIFDGDDLVFSDNPQSNEYGYFGFDLYPFELEPGLEVKVEAETEGVLRTHIVKDLEITAVDMDADQVHGIADGTGSEVIVAHVGDYFAEQAVEAGVDRKWVADFSAEGGLDYKITERIVAREYDEEGNVTFNMWFPPFFTVDPTTDTIAVHRWPANTGLDVTVEDPAGPSWSGSIVTDSNGDYWLSIGDEFDIDTGHTVTVTDGVTTKVHEVTALRIHEVDWENNTISGVAEPGTDVEVRIYDHPDPVRIETADGAGNWTADFSTAVGDEPWQSDYDISPGNAGNANQRDAEGDETHIYWEIPFPFFFVDPYHNDIWGHEWPAGVMLDITIGEDPNDPDWEDQVGVNEWGDFEIWGIDYDIQAGDLLMVATEDGTIIKDHVVTNLRDIEVDPENDLVSGLADPFSEVEVHIHHPGDYHIGRSTEADAQGYWEVDFSVPNEEPHEQAIYNITPGSAGAALQRDDDFDETRINWQVQITANLYWQHDDGRLKVWHMEGHEQIGSSVMNPASVDPAWQVKAVVDSGGDAHSDIYFYNREEGRVKVWLMEGLEKVGTVEINNPAPHRDDIDPVWDMMAVYDLNGSGEPDIIWQALEGPNEGHLAVWMMEYQEAYQTSRLYNVPGEPYVNPDWEIGSIYDLLGDGEPEVIWQAVGGAHEDQLAYWKLDMETFERVASARIYNHPGDPGFNADWRLNASVDLFGDGIEEFLFHHINGGLAYWQLEVDDPDWGVIRDKSGRLEPKSIDPEWTLVGASN